jgi:hypothetical protein
VFGIEGLDLFHAGVGVLGEVEAVHLTMRGDNPWLCGAGNRRYTMKARMMRWAQLRPLQRKKLERNWQSGMTVQNRQQKQENEGLQNCRWKRASYGARAKSMLTRLLRHTT